MSPRLPPDLSELISRRSMVRELGTDALRDTAAQQAVRRDWLEARSSEIAAERGVSRKRAAAMAAKEASKLDATHVLDIVAGGDPSAISGLQNRSVNRSLGSQWARGGRVDALDAALADQIKRGCVKANIKLRPC